MNKARDKEPAWNSRIFSGAGRNRSKRAARAAEGWKETRKETVLESTDERDQEGDSITDSYVALSRRSQLALFYRSVPSW
jgi:hypothetical protein